MNVFFFYTHFSHTQIKYCRRSIDASSLPLCYRALPVRLSLTRPLILSSLAAMQMQMLIATLVLRYDIELRDEDMESVEGFMHKPVAVWVRLRRIKM